MGHTATKPDKVNIGDYQNFRDSNKDGSRNHFVSPQLLRIWTGVATFFRNYYWIEFLMQLYRKDLQTLK